MKRTKKKPVHVKATVSPLRLFKRREEFLPIERVLELPPGMRGVYVLYKYRPRSKSSEAPMINGNVSSPTMAPATISSR